MSQRVREYDWSHTPLGPMEQWPEALKLAAESVLASLFPSCLVWGDGLVTLYNDAFQPILGDKPDALGRSFADVWSEAWAAIGPIADRAFRGEATFIEDFPLEVERRGFREMAYFTFCYSPVRDADGVVVGMVDTVIETTTKFQAMQRLSELAHSLESEVAARTTDRDRMWRLSTDAMLVCRRDGAIVTVNPAFSRLLGWDAMGLTERDITEFVHSDDRQRMRELLAGAPEAGSSFQIENRCCDREGNYRTLVWTTVPDGSRLLLVGRDVTIEREAAAALKRSEAALYQAQKMESVGQLTGGVAHDFNNLLHVISGNLQLLLRVVGKQPTAERYLGNAQAAVQRGAKLASQLLAFARRQPLEPRVVNIARLLPGIGDMLRRTIGDGIDMDVRTSPELWTCFVDTVQIENAVLNLAINARDAMQGVGRLTIDASNVRSGEAVAALPADLPPGDYLALAVSDTGSGMSKALLAKVFEPFFSTKPEGQGSGLGLSMVYGFVKQSGGDVAIDSAPGQGTTVTLYLPRSQAEEEDLDEATESDVVEGGTETILVAEDDDDVRSTVVEMLTQLGYQVLKARDAASALTIIEGGAAVDMLFTDVVMPGPLRSTDLARLARETLPDLAVLFTSGYTQDAIMHGGRLDAGVELIGKPYGREALARKIRSVFAKQAVR